MDFDGLANWIRAHVTRAGPLLDRLETILPALEAMVAAGGKDDSAPTAADDGSLRGDGSDSPDDPAATADSSATEAADLPPVAAADPAPADAAAALSPDDTAKPAPADDASKAPARAAKA